MVGYHDRRVWCPGDSSKNHYGINNDYEYAVANELFLEQGKYTLKIFAVRDVEIEAWLSGEHFPHQEGVLVLTVSVDMFSFSKGATDSSAAGSTAAVPQFKCAAKRGTLIEDASVLRKCNTAVM